MADFMMRPWVQGKKNIVAGLLFEVVVPSSLTLLVDVFHFYHTMHGLTLIFRMTRISNLGFIFEKSVLAAHRMFDVKVNQKLEFI